MSTTLTIYITATATLRDNFHFRFKNMTIGSNKKAVMLAKIMGTETGMIKYAAINRAIITRIRKTVFLVTVLFKISPAYIIIFKVNDLKSIYKKSF